MALCSRRNFLKTGLAAGALAAAGRLPLRGARGTATDWVTLGKSGVKVTRLALGTGTHSGQVQRDMGQEQFTRMVRYAYDRGIRFFETSESYGDMHRMLGIALKGLPRDSYRLMSKITTYNHDGVDPQAKLDELRKLAQTDYFDIMLLHWQHTPNWPTETARWQDGLLEAQSKKVIIGRGASVHGLPALRKFPGNQFLQIAMIRMNHKGTIMDGEDFNASQGNVPEVVEHVKQVKSDGMGVISMKLVGEGRFTTREDRQAAMKFAFNNAGVDSVTVGYKNTAEVDEAIENLNLALA
ncbi:MAG TPA: aldo/keto reductase [Verrucomicrobiae bacterium]|nr:aldo/keto reductase [Verrucomicrobiae bacterium]